MFRLITLRVEHTISWYIWSEEGFNYLSRNTVRQLRWNVIIQFFELDIKMKKLIDNDFFCSDKIC